MRNTVASSVDKEERVVVPREVVVGGNGARKGFKSRLTTFCWSADGVDARSVSLASRMSLDGVCNDDDGGGGGWRVLAAERPVG